jgi:hypothetical protein
VPLSNVRRAYRLSVTFERRAGALASALVTMAVVAAGCAGSPSPPNDSMPVITKTLACPTAVAGGVRRQVNVNLSEVSGTPHPVTLHVGQRLRVHTASVGARPPRPIHVVDKGLSVQHVMCLARETATSTSRVAVFVAVNVGLVSVADFPDTFAGAATPYESLRVNVT